MRDRVSPVLIGRHDAMELALRRWRSATEGHGELLLVAGESGIGKTRLLAEIVARIGVPSPRATGRPREMDAPGELIHGLADELRRIGRTEPATRLRQRLLDETDESHDVTRKRRVLLGDLAQIILELLDGEPVLLRFDDLHWADELSLDVLERVAQNLDTSHGLVIGTYRTDELFAGSPLRSWRARLLEQRLAEEVRLPRLDKSDIAQLVEAITGERPPSTVVESLQRRSDGIPLHIEELVAAETESAVLETVGDAVSARLAQLEPSRRTIVSAASVIGRSFDVRLLEKITASSAETVADALRAASDLHIVVQHPDAHFGFRHSIVCDVTYDEIPVAQRAGIHAAVAAAAAGIGLGHAFVSEHYERAGESWLAHEHALAAAHDAVRVSAHREAAQLFERAERTAPPDTHPAARADLLTRLATELAAIDEVDAAVTRFQAAIELQHELGNDIAAARIMPEFMAMRHLLGDDLETRAGMALDALARLDRHPGEESRIARAGLLGALSAAHMLDRRLTEALEYGERAIALLDESEPMALDVRLSIGATLVFAGRGDEGWAMLERAIRAAQAAGLEAVASRGFRMIGSSASVLLQYDRAFTWITEGLRYTAEVERWNDHHYLHAHRGHVRWATGDWARAAESARHAITDGAGITTQIIALHVLGYLALAQNRLAEARIHLEQARALGERMHELQRVSPALWGLAELALLEGRAAEAVELSELGFAESERVMDAAYLYPYVITATRAHLTQRDPAAARDWITRCARLIDEREIPGTEYAIVHARGLVELAEGRPTEARALLETATEGWISIGRRWEAVHGLVDLARCSRRSKRAADAARLTARALELASGAELLVAMATPATADDASPLSARELEVARLVADGATNREIAERLVIAPKTASAHIEHILAKLGVSRRAEIAAWVAAADGEPSARH